MTLWGQLFLRQTKKQKAEKDSNSRGAHYEPLRSNGGCAPCCCVVIPVVFFFVICLMLVVVEFI